MQNIELKNGYVLVKELVRKREEEINPSGLFIPEETLEDEQVSQGTVVLSSITDYNKSDVVLFHKVMPVDVHLKLEGDAGLQRYFFIKESDVICRMATV